MEAMEASTSTDCGNFHVLPWKLPLTSMGINVFPPVSMEISMDVYPMPPKLVWKQSSFHGSKITSVEIPGKFCGNLRASTVDRTEVGGSLRKSFRSCWKFVILVQVSGSM